MLIIQRQCVCGWMWRIANSQYIAQYHVIHTPQPNLVSNLRAIFFGVYGIFIYQTYAGADTPFSCEMIGITDIEVACEERG